MEFLLLGAVEITVDGRVLSLGPPQQRLIMAILAAEAGRSVSVESLIDRGWDEPPEHPRRALQVHLSRLRRLLDGATGTGQPPVRVVRRSGGYLLDVDPDRVDVQRFRTLIGQARHQDRPAPERAALLGRALDLWRGEPLADLPGGWATRVRQGLRQQYLGAVAGWAEESVRAGDPGAVLARLGELVGEYPLAESLATAYMRALYAAGRPADALDHYTTVRHRLADELGTDPGPELRQLHRQILAADPALTVPEPVATVTTRPVPRQLPAPPQGFTGRAAELAALDQVPDATGMVIATINGMAGVGKTALAVEAAHRLADRYPDGQLFVDLRGFHPSGQMVTPADAVRGFLAALDVAAQQIPSDLDAQAALYRTLLAGKRVLVVLDNARDADQIRPLLPGSPGCLVLVTSRDQLTSLVAAEGARPLAIDLPTREEARRLLAHRLGEARVAAELSAVDEIIARCARLPLALAIAAAHAATRPAFPLAAVAEQLRGEGSRLDALASGDATTDARAVFSWSYQTLSPAAARLFRLLGLHSGPDVSAAAAASLAAVPVPEVGSLLAELCGAHLLIEHAPDRYTFHDLLRAYATELAHTHDSEAERETALHRLLDHYVHTGQAAAGLLNPDSDTVTVPARQAGVASQRFADTSQAREWLTTERPNLLAGITAAGRSGFDAHVVALARIISDLLYWQGSWHDLAATQHSAIDAAGRVDDRAGQANARRTLGFAYIRMERYAEAERSLREAAELYRRIGDPVGEAYAYHGLTYLSQWLERPKQALEHAERALETSLASGHRPSQARELNSVGWCHAQLGDHRRALSYCRRALDLFRELGSPLGEASTQDSLGYAHHHLGEYEAAVACYQAAIAILGEIGNAYSQAEALSQLGDVHLAAGDPEQARLAWRQALAIFARSRLPAADQVQAKLDALRSRA